MRIEDSSRQEYLSRKIDEAALATIASLVMGGAMSAFAVAFGYAAMGGIKSSGQQISALADQTLQQSSAHFDTVIAPGLNSGIPSTVNRTNQGEDVLTGCLLQQKDAQNLYVARGRLVDVDPVMTLNLPVLKNCYNAESVRKATDGLKSDAVLLETAMFVLDGLVGLLGAGGLAFAGINGGLYAYRRRQLKQIAPARITFDHC